MATKAMTFYGQFYNPVLPTVERHVDLLLGVS